MLVLSCPPLRAGPASPAGAGATAQPAPSQGARRQHFFIEIIQLRALRVLSHMTLEAVGVITPERGMRKASPILHSNGPDFLPYGVWEHGGWCSVVGLAVSHTWYFSITADILSVRP